MNKLALLLPFVLFMALSSCNEKNKVIADSVDQKTTKIEVIDFHSTHRCKTCNAIEANTKFTLETYFAKELEEEKITFLTVNVDEESNFEMAEKFEAAGTALFINVIIDGKETYNDLTEFAFMNGNDQDVFSTELKSKIDEELAKL